MLPTLLLRRNTLQTSRFAPPPALIFSSSLLWTEFQRETESLHKHVQKTDSGGEIEKDTIAMKRECQIKSACLVKIIFPQIRVPSVYLSLQT